MGESRRRSDNFFVLSDGVYMFFDDGEEIRVSRFAFDDLGKLQRDGSFAGCPSFSGETCGLPAGAPA